MKKLFNVMVVLAILVIACAPSNKSNEAASDTASVLDTTRLNSESDTSAVQDVKTNGPSESTPSAQYQESNGQQAPRTNVGEDTTGKQPHDNTMDNKN